MNEEDFWERDDKLREAYESTRELFESAYSNGDVIKRLGLNEPATLRLLTVLTAWWEASSSSPSTALANAFLCGGAMGYFLREQELTDVRDG